MRGLKRERFEQRMHARADLGPLAIAGIGAGIGGLLGLSPLGSPSFSQHSNIATPFTLQYLRQMGGLAPGLIGNAMNLQLNAGNALAQYLRSSGFQDLLRTGGFNSMLEQGLRRQFGRTLGESLGQVRELYGLRGLRSGTGLGLGLSRTSRDALQDFGVTLGGLYEGAQNRRIQAGSLLGGLTGQQTQIGAQLLNPFTQLAGLGMPAQMQGPSPLQRFFGGAGQVANIGANIALMSSLPSMGGPGIGGGTGGIFGGYGGGGGLFGQPSIGMGGGQMGWGMGINPFMMNPRMGYGMGVM